MENATIDMVYTKLQRLEKKIDEIESILLLPEEMIGDKEMKEFQETREEMRREGGISLSELERKRKAR